MTTFINADNGVVSGVAGLKYSADSSGLLALQTNTTTALTIDTTQGVTLATGLLATNPFAGSYTSGIVIDHTTNLGRITVGSSAAIAFYNGGISARVESMRIDANGMVGVGVVPSAWRTSYGQKAIQFGPVGFVYSLSASSTNNQTLLGNNYYVNSGGSAIYINSDYATSYQQAFGTHAWNTAPQGTSGGAATLVEVMRLDTSGNLGIGTTSPTYKLDVAGNTRTTGYYSVNDVGYIRSSTGLLEFQGGSTATRFMDSSYSSELMRITQAGNVGIGTTTMAGRLNVNATGANSRIAIGDTAASTYSTVLMYGGSGKYNFQLGVQNNVNNAFEITPSTAAGGTTFSTPAFVLDSSGNVGIGTSSPSSYSAKLAIVGNQDSKLISYMRNDSSGSSSASAIALNAYGNTWGMEIGSAAKNSNSLTWQLDYGGANLERMRLDTSGNLQLSTASTSILNSSGRKMLNQTGGILQVVSATYATSVTNATNTPADTGLTATITPSSTSSKILILISQNGLYKNNANATTAMDINLIRGSTGLLSPNAAGAILETGTALGLVASAAISYLDSPATTSSTTYKTQFLSRNNTSSVTVQYANVSNSTITLLEIAG